LGGDWLKFRLKTGKGAVSGFTDGGGALHLPGDVVDLPSCYEDEAWLERVDPVPVADVVLGKIEPVADKTPTVVSFEAKQKKQRIRKAARIFRKT
jgi:hypothetical protein